MYCNNAPISKLNAFSFFARALPSRCQLSWNPWGRTVQVYCQVTLVSGLVIGEWIGPFKGREVLGIRLNRYREGGIFKIKDYKPGRVPWDLRKDGV